MNNVVIIGAGQTGRGFINRLFCLNGIQVTFLDKDKNLIQELNEKKQYQISFGSQGRPPITVQNYFAYSIDSDEGKNALKDASLIFISVGQGNLKEIRQRLEEIDSFSHNHIDIITGENGVNVSEIFTDMSLKTPYSIAESIIFCTTLSLPGSLDILSENLDYLPYDVEALGYELSIKGMEATKNLDILMQRKIYTYNCISACIAYLGYYKNYENYAEAANDPEIQDIVAKIRKDLDKCISAEYGVPLQEQERFSQMAVKKFENRDIKDTISRNVRDVDRKLSPNDRILAPLHILDKHKVKSSLLLLVLATALFFGEKSKTLKKSPNEYLDSLSKQWKNEVIAYLENMEEEKSLTEIISI